MILLRNISYLVQKADKVLTNIDLLIEGNKIKKIGHFKLDQWKDEVKIIDGTGKIVIPGLVNAHTHLYQNMLKGIRDDLRLKEWCEQVTFPFSRIIHQEHRQHNSIELGYYYAGLGALEMVRSGVTSFVDMDITLDSIFEAWSDIGVRATGALQTVNRWIPKVLMQTEDKKKQEMVGYIEKWHNNGILKVALAPSTPFACTPDYLDWLKQVAEEYGGLQIYIHVSETKWEVEQSLTECNKTPLAYLDSLDFLSRPICAIHCVHLTEDEIELAKKKEVTVIYNPKSNAKLGSGIAPIVTYLKKGIPVTLATDGAASNDLLDMFEEMRFGAMLQKAAYEDPAVISGAEMFKMATEAGAKMLGIEAGILEEGKLADLVVLNPRLAHIQPLHDIIQSLVYCGKASDVETVIIDGKVILENQKFCTVDEEKILQRAIELGNEKYQESRGNVMAAEF
ncbi:MAG: amidohydrolase family protein [Zhaonellaceae bacterium]|nr:amidohydrolase [Clostridia bacterium]